MISGYTPVSKRVKSRKDYFAYFRTVKTLIDLDYATKLCFILALLRPIGDRNGIENKTTISNISFDLMETHDVYKQNLWRLH